MTTEQAANYLMIFFLIVFLTIGLLSMLIGKIVDAWDAISTWWGVGVQKAIHYRPVKPRRALPIHASYAVCDDEEPYEPRSNDFPLPAAIEPRANGSENPAELRLSPAEVTAIHRMIRHNATAAKPSKSSTIQAGFGVSRGGSPAYQRASLIYDALFGVPAPAIRYRQRTPEQEALRQQLRLEKH